MQCAGLHISWCISLQGGGDGGGSLGHPGHRCVAILLVMQQRNGRLISAHKMQLWLDIMLVKQIVM